MNAKLKSSLHWLNLDTPGGRRTLILIALGAFVSQWAIGAVALIVTERRYNWNEPVFWRTPAKLADSSISSARGRKVSYLGYEFEIPWEDLDEQKTRRGGPSQIVIFHSGKAILFSGLLATEDYAFVRAALETTPDDISLFAPERAIRRTIPLLLLKSVLGASRPDSGIFLIQTKNFRGFQYGNPQNHSREIEDDLFSEKGRLHFVFLNKRCANGFLQTDINQSEINRVIQTTRPVRN